jgi:hypothetical protein
VLVIECKQFEMTLASPIVFHKPFLVQISHVFDICSLPSYLIVIAVASFHMDPPLNSLSLWRRLTMREIIEVLPGPTFSSNEKRSWEKLEQAVMWLPPQQLALLECAAVTKVYRLNRSLDDDVICGSGEGNVTEDPFLETVSEDCQHEHISRFIDATGNEATATAMCAVCAGTFFKQEIYEVKVSDLRLKNKLIPSIPPSTEAYRWYASSYNIIFTACGHQRRCICQHL